MLIYKIKSRKTGQFSKGGADPTFTKKGKIWTNIGHVRTHLNCLTKRGHQVYVDHDAEIIVLELIELPIETIDLQECIQETKDRKQEQEQLRKQKYLMWQMQQKKQQYEQLKKEFEQQ